MGIKLSVGDRRIVNNTEMQRPNEGGKTIHTMKKGNPDNAKN